MKEIKSYLSFRVGSEFFAANVAQVRNIMELKKITKLPEMPEFMLGVINQRGEVLPVLDARLKFGTDKTDFTVDTCILDLEVQADKEVMHAGLLVDSVSEVLQIDLEEISEAPSIGTNSGNEFMAGIYCRDEEFIMIIDVEKVVSSDEVIEMSSIAEKVEAE